MAYFFSIGGHWYLVQTVAWGKMFMEFSRTERVDVALEKTLSGKNPCKICRFVEKNRKSAEDTSSIPFEIKNKEWGLFHAVSSDVQPALSHRIPYGDVWLSVTLNLSPPTPPPKALA